MYQVKKRFAGYSTCFRQHKADSHCKFLHGYALEFVATFESETLDEQNWVIDFGGFKDVKEKLKEMFDHTTAVAMDDPFIEEFWKMDRAGIINLMEFRKVGCEAFALAVFEVIKYHTSSLVNLVSVKCIENENNSATYKIK